MTTKDTAFIGGGIGLMVLAIATLKLWSKWRKQAIIEAGRAFGFHHLTEGEVLPVVTVPLINRPNPRYFVILRGTLNGYEAGFFDLFCTSGKSWDCQSTVIVKNPRVMMPRFQLQTPQRSQARQQTCGDALNITGREKDMTSLRLSADDAQWARQTCAKATPEFLQKLRKGKWTIEGFQHSLVIYRWGQRIPPRKLQEYVRQAGELSTEMYALCF